MLREASKIIMCNLKKKKHIDAFSKHISYSLSAQTVDLYTSFWDNVVGRATVFVLKSKLCCHTGFIAVVTSMCSCWLLSAIVGVLLHLQIQAGGDWQLHHRWLPFIPHHLCLCYHLLGNIPPEVRSDQWLSHSEWFPDCRPSPGHTELLFIKVTDTGKPQTGFT